MDDGSRRADAPPRAVLAMGLAFPGPVGLAAGFDRAGRHLDAARDWGFGFVEVGTVTPATDAGHGLHALAEALAGRRNGDVPAEATPLIGVNLGADPGGGPQAAWRDYGHAVATLRDHADFLVLNFSSDAAGALRDPRMRRDRRAALTAARDARESPAATPRRRPALLVKWPMDTDPERARDTLDDLVTLGYDGLVAAFHETPASPPWEEWVPPTCRALVAIAPDLCIVAVGGIDRPARARAAKDAGVPLVEMHRGFTAGGSPLVRTIDDAMAG